MKLLRPGPRSAGKYLVMLGTAFDTKGGVSSVINVYRQHGLFERWPIVYLATHCDGSKLHKIVRAAGALIRYVGLLASGTIAVVHVHTSSDVSFWRKSIFIVLGLITKRQVIVHLHGGGFAEYYEGRGELGKRFIRFVLDRACYVIVLSSQWKSWVAGVSANPNIVCLYNPVTCNTLGKSARNSACLLFLGRMSKDKGVFDLLDVVAHLKSKHSALRLLCAGDGDAGAVVNRATQLHINESVEVLGWVSGKAKDELLASAGMLVLPSYYEGLPMSVLEAMAAGIPVVTTPVGGIPDAVKDGASGLLVTPGDKDGLSFAIDRLLADAGLQERMGSEGRRIVTEKFSVDVIVPRLEEIYTQLKFAPRTVQRSLAASAKSATAVTKSNAW